MVRTWVLDLRQAEWWEGIGERHDTCRAYLVGRAASLLQGNGYTRRPG
eukprot:COSAG06_NODE_2499_length_6756_cov_5.158780_11_plen_47_part_01